LVAEKNKHRETVKIPRRGGTGRNTRVLPSAADQSREYSDAETPVGGSIRNNSVEKKPWNHSNALTKNRFNHIGTTRMYVWPPFTCGGKKLEME